MEPDDDDDDDDDDEGNELDSCERYDILTDTWEELKEATLPFPALGVNLVGIGMRYILAFGFSSN